MSERSEAILDLKVGQRLTLLVDECPCTLPSLRQSVAGIARRANRVYSVRHNKRDGTYIIIRRQGKWWDDYLK